MKIPENDAAHEKAKTARQENLLLAEKYSQPDLINWIKMEALK
jgi:hypothetical protein